MHARFCLSYFILQSVAVVQRAIRKRDPAEEMEEMGFGALTLVSSFPVSMSGGLLNLQQGSCKIYGSNMSAKRQLQDY